jgi:hypothetical protein
MDLSEKIDVVRDISVREFEQLYFNKQKPVIIKGLIENTAAGKWSIDHFKDRMGDTIIDVFDNNKKNNCSAFTVPDLKMKLGDFLSEISKDEPTGLRIFLYNMFKHNKELRKEFPCPDLFKGVLDHIGYMFFGGKNTKVRIHYDIDMSNVLHTHFQGRKKVVLISPEYNDLLYCLPLNTYSLIDPDKPDHKKYPGLQYVKGYEFILEAGDSVFIPSGYWHYMTYLESGFSVSYRRLNLRPNSLMNGFLNLGVRLPFDKLMNKLLGDNWLENKKQIAERRANWAIQKHYGSEVPKPLFSSKIN